MFQKYSLNSKQELIILIFQEDNQANKNLVIKAIPKDPEWDKDF